MRLGFGFFGSGSSGAPSPSFAPTDLSGLKLWLSADSTTDTGDGTAVSAMADLSPTGASVVEGGSGLGPLRRDASGRRGKRVVEYSNGKWTKTLDATIAALANGAAADLTVVELWQPTSNGTSYTWAWGHTTQTTKYLSKRRGALNYLDDITRRDATNNSSVTISAIEHLTPQVSVSVLDATAGTVTHRIDGVQTAVSPATLARGTQTIDTWAEGALPAGASPTLSCTKYRRHLLIWNRKLTLSEIQQLETWLAGEWGVANIGLKWKGGFSTSATFGNGSNGTLVIAIIGQSNGAGRGTTPYASVYAGTSQAGYVLYPDNNLDEAAEPTTYPTGVVGSAAADSTQAATGFVTRLVDRLRANGETRNIIAVDCCVGGTSSTVWNTSTTTSPPPVNGMVGNAKHRISEALKAPNSKLRVVVYQGESNTSGSPTVAAWSTDWTAVLNEFNTYFIGKFDKTCHFWIINLPVTPWTLATSTNWPDLRAAIVAFVSGRSDCRLVQAPDGPTVLPDKLHLDTGSNTPANETGHMKLGVDIGDDMTIAA